MPSGIYKRKPCSEETKRKISLAQKLERVPRKCLICENVIYLLPCHEKTKKYCSKKCANIGISTTSPKRIKNCAYCNKEFVYYPYQIKNKNGRFCSRMCGYKYRIGENNPNWKGGNSREKHNTRIYKRWTKKVFERDKYICQVCFKKCSKLQADHIKPWATYPKLRYKLSNGRTVCIPCHKIITKEQWKNKVFRIAKNTLAGQKYEHRPKENQNEFHDRDRA